MKYVSFFALLAAVICSTVLGQNRPQGYRNLQLDAGAKSSGKFILSKA